MSKVERTICDFCGKETRDHYIEKGWIRIEAAPHLFSIRVSLGRKADKTAKGNYSSHSALDFCRLACLNGFIEKHRDTEASKS